MSKFIYEKLMKILIILIFFVECHWICTEIVSTFELNFDLSDTYQMVNLLKIVKVK